MEKTGFFEESPGQKSNIRLMSAAAMIVSMIIGLKLAFIDYITYNQLALLGIFIVAAFAPKVVQKFAESKIK